MERNKKISQLNYAEVFNDQDVVPIVQEEQNKKLNKETMFKGYYKDTEVDKLISNMRKDIGANTDELQKQVETLEQELQKYKQVITNIDYALACMSDRTAIHKLYIVKEFRKMLLNEKMKINSFSFYHLICPFPLIMYL